MHKNIYNNFRHYDEKSWVGVILRSPDEQRPEGIQLPGFPPPELQISMIGSSGEQALREVSSLYLLIHFYMKNLNKPFTDTTKILDFGCGYGRILRFFMKDVAPGNLIGTDVDPGFIDICRTTFSGGEFDINQPTPPLAYPDASFDVIYAYSIFTHLSEDAHLLWLQEFKRILNPGGLIFLTLRQKSFLVQCREWAAEPEHSAYVQMICKAFGDYSDMIQRYNNGEYIYAPHGEGGIRTSDYYGDTVISPQYIKRHWTPYFHVVDQFDDLARLSQALIVLSNEPQSLPSLNDANLNSQNVKQHSLFRKIIQKILPK